MYEWNDLKEEFEVDGSLRDIYIENITVNKWNQFLDYAKSSEYKLEFTHGDQSIEIPQTLKSIKELQETEPTTLFIWLNENIQLHCHFFIETEIELDLSPYDIRSEKDFRVLLAFIEDLAQALENRVIVTHEGMQEQVILSSDSKLV
ncbi:hypothetical protein N473_26505 [Pseudoalteromonas luteoviolacea CPMOR-1]|uniref:Protein export chaperone SecB n=1 Tax=Pseudoalteromonas luteoviolacea CPMOR-1 TaxID=1365248 RepID=A0A167HCS2_9GAMM|nr:hypothetical protein [Pseudoalteromonas luteoviolacea]KZN57979.1 hypothetical protein N473_26505 [Pseudoalteromonas luteoviolacea CPMOR-1]